MAGSSPRESCSTITEWRAQAEAMKAAVARLKTTRSAENVDESDWDDDEIDRAYQPRDGPRDVWDFISDDELDDIGFDSGDLFDGVDGEASGADVYDVHWLAARCADISSRKSGLAPSALQDHIMDILGTSRPEGELQSMLTDLVGFDDLD